MHYANLKKSKRLQKLAAFLRDRKPHSTMEIIKRTGICAVNSAISELRRNGIDIAPAMCGGTTVDGNKVYLYLMV